MANIIGSSSNVQTLRSQWESKKNPSPTISLTNSTEIKIAQSVRLPSPGLPKKSLPPPPIPKDTPIQITEKRLQPTHRSKSLTDVHETVEDKKPDASSIFRERSTTQKPGSTPSPLIPKKEKSNSFTRQIVDSFKRSSPPLQISEPTPKDEKPTNLNPLIASGYEKSWNACNQSIQNISDFLKYIEQSKTGDPKTAYLASVTLNVLAAELRSAEKRALIEIHKTIRINNPNLNNACEFQEKLIGELSQKVSEFIMIMKTLHDELKKGDIILYDKKEKKEIAKENLLKALDDFFKDPNLLLLDKQISQLKDTLYADEEIAAKTFNGIEKYFSLLKTLGKAFVDALKMRLQVVVVKKGSLTATYYLQFEKEYKSANKRDASEILYTIPRELFQFSGLLLELKKYAQAIKEQQKKEVNPFSNSKILDHFSLLETYLTELFKSMNDVRGSFLENQNCIDISNLDPKK